MALQEHCVVDGRRPSLLLERLEQCGRVAPKRVDLTQFHRRGSASTPETRSDWTLPPPRADVPRGALRSASRDPMAAMTITAARLRGASARATNLRVACPGGWRLRPSARGGLLVLRGSIRVRFAGGPAGEQGQCVFGGGVGFWV